MSKVIKHPSCPPEMATASDILREIADYDPDDVLIISKFTDSTHISTNLESQKDILYMLELAKHRVLKSIDED